ncbi:uncharacterized protein LOC130818562 [Amaranthus tricolor]|uniref:uncharacterized protein LOC130818562 n=1 Tax=Amaranthus tricolor TaxID=29722 RepID=UPI002584A451|nr:uncharacterized protein LOC130818562 [Amaranthus tricolor]
MEEKFRLRLRPQSLLEIHVVIELLRKKIVKKNVESKGKIMWGRLKGDMVIILSSKISLLGFPSQSEDAKEIWVNMAKNVRTVAKETLGVSSGKPKVFKESWWWNDEVEKKIKDKNKRFKDLMACTEDEDMIEKRVGYKEEKQVAKQAVTEAKNRGYEDLYRKLDTKEGEKQIFKLARTRSRQRQDLEAVKYIKDEGGRVLLRQEDIKTRWLQYFSQLLNNESWGPKETDNQIYNVQRPLEYGSTSDITTREVR